MTVRTLWVVERHRLQQDLMLALGAHAMWQEDWTTKVEQFPWTADSLARMDWMCRVLGFECKYPMHPVKLA